MALLIRSNDALKINPPVADHNLTVHGSDWLWAVTAIYCLFLLVVIGLAYVAKQGEKIFHYLFTISLLVGSIAYFTMASDLGVVPIKVSSTLSSPGTREIFYAKYINWFVGWTPLIIAVGLIAGVSWATIVYNVALSWTWIATWLSGAMVATHYKWGFFVFGLFAYFLLAASLLHTGMLTAKRLNITKHYIGIASYLVFLWLLYPIAWGLDDGGNKISVTSGFIFFGILDLLTVPVLSIGFLFLSRSWDHKNMNLYFTQYGRVAQSGNFPEKAVATAPAAEPEQVV
jgi:bacteriorhodopsin